jgi:predicted nucleic acid-binding protein
MMHSIRFTAVLDTNVIYPLEIRDLLLWFAYEGLYTPKWSQHIFNEWRNVMKEKNVAEDEIEKSIENVLEAFPDAKVQNYECLVDNLDLPDIDDCHVLAAAIKTNANLIVTNNLKDFPVEYICAYGLCAKLPDEFLPDLIDLFPEKAITAFTELVQIKTRSELDKYEVLDKYRRIGLKDTADYLHALL